MLYLFGKFRVLAEARAANPSRALCNRNAERVWIAAAVFAQVFGCFEAAAATFVVQHWTRGTGPRSLRGGNKFTKRSCEETESKKQTTRPTSDSK
jgi:hypothetical protein